MAQGKIRSQSISTCVGPQPSQPSPRRVMGRGQGTSGRASGLHCRGRALSSEKPVMDRKLTGLGSKGDALLCKELPLQTFLEGELETKAVEPLLGRRAEMPATSEDWFPNKRLGDRGGETGSDRLSHHVSSLDSVRAQTPPYSGRRGQVRVACGRTRLGACGIPRLKAKGFTRPAAARRQVQRAALGASSSRPANLRPLHGSSTPSLPECVQVGFPPLLRQIPTSSVA